MSLKQAGLAAAFVVLACLSSGAAVRAQGGGAGVCPCAIPDGPPNPRPYLVGYLGVYKNLDWVAVAKTLDFNKMTHLNLAFINPPMCDGSCTASSSLALGGNQSFTE